MPNEDQLSLRQADQARTDFAIIETELEARLSQLPSVLRRQSMIDAILAAIGLIIILGLGLFGLMLTGPG
jgi:CHASE3 domain sensor protein